MPLNYIDLFAGCGGLSEGFHKNPNYNFVAAVEWEKDPANTLIYRLKTKWQDLDAEEKVLRFDIQRTEELFNGWENDPEYGTHHGLNAVVGNQTIDLIIGGPPCQAYSMAGRAQDNNDMKDDYRNYLFESYIKVVDRYQPKLFVFENVVGLLSAQPKDTPVTELIRDEFDKHGYAIVSDLKKYALQDLSEFGVPQNRKRVIIIGIRKDLAELPEDTLKKFYTQTLVNYHSEKISVQQAIGDLPKLLPAKEYKMGAKKFSHTPADCGINGHHPRYHNAIDIEIFKILSSDIETGSLKYITTQSLQKLYLDFRGRNSLVHKYYVLRQDQQSNTITAHLHKDGLRHIHYDSQQARSITVREAARLQSFDDDFEFICSSGSNYKMIGNAVPPLFSEKLAHALLDIIARLQ